jgi:hypothetical protein
MCRSVVLNSAFHTYTTPGSYADHGPGSCPAADLSAVLSLVARFRKAVLGGGDVCALLPADYRSNAERWAGQSGGTCSQAALREGDATAAEVGQPLAQIRLTWVSAAPAHKSGFVIFQTNPHEQRVAGGNPLVIAIIKRSTTWEIAQLGYQF